MNFVVYLKPAIIHILGFFIMTYVQKKNENFPPKTEIPQSWLLGLLSLLNTNLITKNTYDVELRVHRSVFMKFLFCSLTLKYVIHWVFRREEHR